MLALKKPYELYTMTKLKERVWNGEHKRPFVDKTWPRPVQILFNRSWSKTLAVRPSFAEITESLRKQCVEARGGNEEGLEHTRRRSTFVFAKVNMESMPFMSSTFSRRDSLNDTIGHQTV